MARDLTPDELAVLERAMKGVHVVTFQSDDVTAEELAEMHEIRALARHVVASIDEWADDGHEGLRQSTVVAALGVIVAEFLAVTDPERQVLFEACLRDNIRRVRARQAH